jgi:4-hydroxybenzoate polyprenyltransferase
VRWYNIFFLALSQYLATIFILNDQKNWLHTLKNVDLHLIVFASLFSVAGGYIINNFYDLEKDLINRPNKTIYEKIIRQSTTLRIYFLFNFITAILALSVSFNVFIFFSLFVFSLWFYSHKLKKITFIGNLIASLLAITPFFAIFLYYNLEDLLVLTYVTFILLIIFLREIIKDLKTLKGDIIMEYNTLPVRLGVRKTKWLITGFALSGIIPVSAIFIKTHFSGISFYLLLGLSLLLLSLLYLAKAEEKKHYIVLNNLYRVLIIGGILSLVLIGH